MHEARGVFAGERSSGGGGRLNKHRQVNDGECIFW